MLLLASAELKRLSHHTCTCEGRHCNQRAARLLQSYRSVTTASMNCMLAEGSLCWRSPFRTQNRPQHCRQHCIFRRTRCEAVHRRHVALQLAAQDLSFETSDTDSTLHTAKKVQDRTAVNRRSLALAAATLGLLPSFRALAGECCSFCKVTAL